MPLVSTNLTEMQEARRHAHGTRTGTRTEADFTITLGFKPTRIRVCNLTDRIEADHVVDSTLGTANVESLKTVAAGTRTYEDCGIRLTADGLGFTVDISVAGLASDNDDCYWEAWS